MDTAGFDTNAAFPPLRPAAKISAAVQDQQASRDAPTTAALGEIEAPRQIEEHEVEMYKEQDVSFLPVPPLLPFPSSLLTIFHTRERSVIYL
jgi:hypothetical protein